jgi:diguanylate cyclase (GGDEF)-like protein/PAS domain S-box-containing protein
MQKQISGRSVVDGREVAVETTGKGNSESASQRDPIRWLVGGGIILIAAIAIGTAIMISSFRERALESGERELENAVRLLARHFDQRLEDFEVVQNDLVNQARSGGYSTPEFFRREMSTYETHLMLKAKVSGTSDVAGVNVYDAEGMLINSSEAWPVPVVNVADRAYFMSLRSTAASMPYQIELVRSRLSGAVATVIARKITGPDGEFLGVATRGFDPAKFEEFFSSIALGKDAAITMHHRDGTLLARFPHIEGIIGNNFKLGSTPQAKLLNSDRGTARLTSPMDGRERLASVQSFGHFPLSVVATTTVDSALADWRAQTKFTIIFAAVSASVIAGLLFLIARRLSLQHQTLQRRQALEKQRLDTAINNMTQGLTLFDHSRRLIVCNQRYIDMYGLSAAVVKPGCSFRDLIAHRSEVGSLQSDVDEHCARILEHVAREEGVIVNTPDGRSIQVTHRLVSDGGWVATHEDITERERSEVALLESKTLLHSTLSALKEGVIVQDVNGRIISYNPAAERILGLRPDSQLGATAIDPRLWAIHEDGRDFAGIGHPSTLALETGVPQHDIVMGLRNDVGSVTWISINSIPICAEPAAKPTSVVTSFSDITARKRAQELLKEAVNASPDALVIYDENDRLVTCNDAYRQIYAQSAASIYPGALFKDVILCGLENNQYPEAGETPAQRSAWFAERMSIHSAPSMDALQHLSNGRWIQLRERRTASGLTVGFRIDVTELQNKTAELSRLNMQFQAALSNMTQGICMFDSKKRLVVWNERLVELYNFSPEFLKVGLTQDETVADLVSRGILKCETSESKVIELDRLPSDGYSSRVEELTDGRLILVARQPTADGGWVATHEDITERRRAEAEVVYLARHDVLTGLANRAEFNAKLEEATKRLKRNGVSVTVMMIDLDKFKAVNDALGHLAGDQLLVEVAGRLKGSVRETDILARLGGDEFAIIQEGGPNPSEGAIALALRIINSLTEPFDLCGNQANVGVSIGIALGPEHGAEPGQLLKRADLALYNVKSGGRNDFRIFQAEMLEFAQEQKSAESELRDAIARDEFELHYQPVMDAKTRLLCGAEALVRWRHPVRGLIGPDRFIPLAESTGLIAQLGEWVLQRACADAASWPEHLKVAINISAVQFKKKNLFDIILCTLLETGLPPQRLELEITETALLENQEVHLSTIRQLKNLGVSLALDDFGTGYSSMNYLTVFPFDKIKIDKSFTQGVLNRRDCKAIVASTLALAQGLGTVTTAEGVETEEQFEYMREAGVDLVQGYLLGRPVPVAQLELHIADARKEMVA